jgi:hypothetical protein
MEMLGALTGLIGAGLQAQAQHDQLNFQYAHFNWEKQRANEQERFAEASRTDMYGNTTKYDPVLNKWVIDLSPDQTQIRDAGSKEQLLQLTKDAPAARKIKEAIQQRAKDAREPYNRAQLGYQYDLPESEGAIRSDLTGLMATNDMMKSKADQATLMRGAARLGTGAKAAEIINATDQALGQGTQNRMLNARNQALQEYGTRVQQHEQKYGKPMELWGNLMGQGGDIPPIPKSSLNADLTGAVNQQASGITNAMNAGTAGVSAAYKGLADAAGKSPDLNGLAKMLADIGKGQAKKQEQTYDATEDPYNYSGESNFGQSYYNDNARADYGVDYGGGDYF